MKTTGAGWVAGCLPGRMSRGAWLRGITMLALTWLATPVAAEVYTGVGAHGVRWFSDVRPPEGVAYQVLQVAAVPADPPAEAPAAATEAPAKAAPVAPAKPAARQGQPAEASAPRKRRSRADIQQEAQQKRCRGYDTALRKLRAQRRAGYTVSQDRQQRQRRKELQDKQFAECSLRAGG